MAKLKKDDAPLITEDIKWYEDQLSEAKDYLTSINLKELIDRPVKKGTSTGGVTEVMVTREDIAEHKFRMLAQLPKLIATVNDLRKIDIAKKVEMRKGFEDEDEDILG